MSRILKTEVPALPDNAPAAFPAFSKWDGTGGTLGSLSVDTHNFHSYSFCAPSFPHKEACAKLFRLPQSGRLYYFMLM